MVVVTFTAGPFTQICRDQKLYLCDVDARDLQAIDVCTEVPDTPAPLEILTAARDIMIQHNVVFPQSIDEAISL